MHRGLGYMCAAYLQRSVAWGAPRPSTFGHGGAGTSYSWADPGTGVSFTYLTNSQMAEPYHSRRLDEIMTIAHAAVVEL